MMWKTEENNKNIVDIRNVAIPQVKTETKNSPQ